MRADDLGQGPETKRKQQHFGVIQPFHFRLADLAMRSPKNLSWAGQEYHYVDLTAGPGRYADIIGSPIRFCMNASGQSRDWRAWFCEMNPNHAAQLDEEIASLGEEISSRSEVLPYDHAQGVVYIQRRLYECNGSPFGLVYVDTNGTLQPVEVVRDLVRPFKQLDVLLYVAAATYKRCRGAFRDEERPLLSEHLLQIGKKEMLIREPHANWQWTFVLLTNWASYPELRSIDFYNINSKEGRAILDRLDLTASELRQKQSAERDGEEGQLELW